jgi:hypothetical protein
MEILKLKLSPISIRELNNILVLLLISLIGIISIDVFSIISFVLFLLLSFLLGRIFFKGQEDYKIILLFCFYTILAILIYWFQYIQFPQNGGATGEGIFGGTDDLYFFQEATQHGISYRGDRSMNMHTYAKFLLVFNNIIHIFKIPKLLDLLFVNILAFTFIPVFTKKVAEFLKFPDSSIKLVFYLSAICPIMIINGLVLVRDGWTAMLLISSIYFILNHRIVLLIMALLLSFYLRVSSGAITLIFIAVIVIFVEKSDIPSFGSRKKLFYLVWLLAAILISIPSILFYLKMNGIDNSFFREGLLEFIESSSDTKSAANFIYNLPAPLRICLGPFFYFGTPFLSIKAFLYNHQIVIRPFIEQFFSLLFIIYFALFIQFIGLLIKMKKDKVISLLFFTYVIAIFALSQLSLQPRHKTMLMPVFYLIVAYGYQNRNRSSMYVALSISVIMFSLEIIYNFI